jgi:hypothetical protein
MFWGTLDFSVYVKQYLPTFLRDDTVTSFLGCINAPLNSLYTDTLYKMQHNGTTIDLEHILNQYFQVVGYDDQNHDATKKVYIDDVPQPDKLYIYQDEEDGVSFLGEDDEDTEDDVFLDNDGEGVLSYSWIIYIPDTYVFQEYNIRALVDTYRYFGKKYIIETYTL